ncbi:hypothetical protein ISCGN_009863 [Ixodes scapularis]
MTSCYHVTRPSLPLIVPNLVDGTFGLIEPIHSTFRKRGVVIPYYLACIIGDKCNIRINSTSIQSIHRYFLEAVAWSHSRCILRKVSLHLSPLLQIPSPSPIITSLNTDRR